VLKQLFAPGGDLGGVYAMARGELGERGVAPQRLQGKAGLEL